MRHPEGPRTERRLRARREQRRREAEADEKPNSVERHLKDRRSTSMTPDEVNDWLKRNGITGGDRRKPDRR